MKPWHRKVGGKLYKVDPLNTPIDSFIKHVVANIKTVAPIEHYPTEKDLIECNNFVDQYGSIDYYPYFLKTVKLDSAETITFRKISESYPGIFCFNERNMMAFAAIRDTVLDINAEVDIGKVNFYHGWVHPDYDFDELLVLMSVEYLKQPGVNAVHACFAENTVELYKKVYDKLKEE